MDKSLLNKQSIRKHSAGDVKSAEKIIKKPITKKEMDFYNEKFHNSDEFLSSVLTLGNQLSAMRENMNLQQLPQAQMIINPERPRVYTGYEHEVGKYSKSYYMADRDWEVIDRVFKYPKLPELKYFLIVKDANDNFDIIEREHHIHLTEHYGYRRKNDVIDAKNDTNNKYIRKGEILYKSTAFDDNMNYMYGINGRCVWMAGPHQMHDPITISKSFAEKLMHPEITSVSVNINLNHVLINLYGDDRMYKTFPDIGEKVVDSVLCAKRNINNRTILHLLQNENLKYVHEDDEAYYADGVITDIEIFCNRKDNELRENNANSQLLAYYRMQQEYWKKVKQVLGKIIQKHPKSVSDRLLKKYHRAEDLISSKIIVDKNSTFENMMVVFTVYNERPAYDGYKLTGRFGEKGVIKIVPDEDMPVNQYGERADIRVSPKGTFGRLNSGQWSESEVCFIADNIVRELKTHNIPAPIGIKKIIEFAYDVYKPWAEKLEKFVSGLDMHTLNAYYSEILNNGLDIEQPPFWGNVACDELKVLYDKYKYPRYRMFIKGKPVIKRCIMGTKYVMLLKQTTKSKYSARGLGMSSATGHPAKSMRYKKHIIWCSDTPIRIGDMELSNFAMMNQMKELKKFLSCYSTSPENLASMVTQILNAPDVFDIHIQIPETKSINRKMLNAYAKGCGGCFVD